MGVFADFASYSHLPSLFCRLEEEMLIGALLEGDAHSPRKSPFDSGSGDARTAPNLRGCID
jgi:hypothetical protein